MDHYKLAVNGQIVATGLSLMELAAAFTRYVVAGGDAFKAGDVGLVFTVAHQLD